MARKILLADDSVTAQNMGRKILADARYDVITVNNGSAALKRITETKPDLIVLDVYMPGYSGLEVCQRLKDAQETSRVPVLLTVGKLEPFKPEEARRARADGFIVKPFEASELLSALSKLEDKIVPRSESKPGRFARANAAMDEGRYDKSVAVDEDSGWKNRIGFPKKKAEPAPEEADDSTIYNAMNKDLRTVVERKPAEKPREFRAEEPRVDLGALAPEGLPKDVTPEEIAALAAAAAQVKGKIAEANEPLVPAWVEQPAPAPEPAQAAPALPHEVAEAAPSAATFAAQKPEETIEEKIEAKFEPKSEAKSEAKTEAKTEANADETPEKPADALPEAASIAAPSIPAPSHADLMSAIAALEPEPAAASGPSSVRPSLGNSSAGSWLERAADQADEPVTMAVAAGMAESVTAASRWTAVATTLAPEEAAISLEHEMQKAYAAFAAAASVRAGASATIPEPQSQHPHSETPQAQAPQSQAPQSQPAPAPSASTVETSSLAEAAPRSTAALEPVVAVPATLVQEVERSFSAVTSVATDAISAAVQELEAKAAAYAEQMKPAPPPLQPAPVKDFIIASPHAPEAPQTVAGSGATSFSTSTAANPEQSAAPVPEIPQVESPRPEASQPADEEPNRRREELSQQEIEEPEMAEAKIEPKFEPKIEEPKIESKVEEPKIEEAKLEESKVEESKIEESKIEEVKIDGPKIEAVKIEEVKSEVAPPVPAAAAAVTEPTSTGTATAPEKAPTPANEVPPISSEIESGKFSSSSIFSSDIVSSNIVSSNMAAGSFDEPSAGGIGDMAKKESEIAANTAAAWASWRRIRETDPKAASPSADPSGKEDPIASTPQDAAAMAVAAGAEKSPEEARAANDSDPDDIAGIVDSVLADMRPKIVEEISRKMGKKK